MIRTRFAPSPTGRLHLGHVLAARVAWGIAKKTGGEFLLRHEDIDGERVREEYYAGIEGDLRWLGLEWDGGAMRQTTRRDVYDAALEELKERKLVYPCFCTRREIREELARMGEAPHGPAAAIYPGICRNLTEEERAEKLAAGLSPAWRLDAARAVEVTGPLIFRDLRLGTMEVNAALAGDVVLARKDIGTAYHLAVTVDDADQRITLVTRGEDLLEATHVHRLLQRLLDLPEPCYLHHALICDAAGERLAKRSDAESISTLRDQGVTPAQVLAMTDTAYLESLAWLRNPNRHVNW